MARPVGPDPTEKVCSKCRILKDISEYSFKRPTNRRPGWQPRCKICSLEDSNEWRENQSKERLKDLYLRRTYGISIENYNTRMQAQGSQCLLCRKDFDFVSKVGPNIPVVDHCHTLGHVRGILCNECNRGLGYFRDNAMALKRASQYLTGEDLSPEGRS